MRMLMALVLLAGGLVAFPMARAIAAPETCPPACDRIPDAAWMPTWDIPLNSRYAWPALAAVAVTATDPKFRFEELCATATAPKDPASHGPAPQDPRSYAVAERAVVTNPEAQWQLQAQIIHWRGETWRGGKLAEDVFNTAVAALRSCQRSAPNASPSVTVDDHGRMAAVISGPTILHEYLVANPDNSTVTELALWSTAPPLTPWAAVPDLTVLETLAAPLCSAYIGSCP